MPESIEVKLITEQLSKFTKNKFLQEITLLECRYRKITPEQYSQISLRLPLNIIDVKCKGKFIYWELENNWSIWNTLGMTGQWSKENTKHSSVKFKIDNEYIFFNDPRRFGTIKFCNDSIILDHKLTLLGPDIFNDPPSIKEFINIIKKYNKTIVEILMDQSKISGIGNYIKSESLYRAALSPWRIGSSLSDSEITKLYHAIQTVLYLSYKAGGATLATYKDFEGHTGSFFNELLVYKKSFINNFPVTKELTLDKRTTYWVPEIQK